MQITTTMTRALVSITCVCLLLTLAGPSLAGKKKGPSPLPQDAGCALKFTGSDRKAVKLRSPTLDHPFNNGGRAISVADWYALVCPFDLEVPTRRDHIPKTTELPQEKLKVKVQGFLMAVKSEDDNDFHVQMGDHSLSPAAVSRRDTARQGVLRGADGAGEPDERGRGDEFAAAHLQEPAAGGSDGLRLSRQRAHDGEAI
jgi:hypothetical protein